MARGEITTFVCLFHSLDRAEAAIEALEQAGFSRSAITSVWNEDNDPATAASLDQELTEVGVPERDLKHLREGVLGGGVVVSLDAPEDRSDAIEKVFHHYSADKIDETDVDRTPTAMDAVPLMATPAAASTPVAVTEPVTVAGAAVVPVVAEDLVVGKREVDRGGVRVFRRTVAEPVQQDVTLREEHVALEVRPVDRAVTAADVAAAAEVIELTETEEVPVVSKVARVVEEVRVGIVGSEHTETVHDTVRHTEVEVEPVDGIEAEGTRDRFEGNGRLG